MFTCDEQKEIIWVRHCQQYQRGDQTKTSSQSERAGLTLEDISMQVNFKMEKLDFEGLSAFSGQLMGGLGLLPGPPSWFSSVVRKWAVGEAVAKTATPKPGCTSDLPGNTIRHPDSRPIPGASDSVKHQSRTWMDSSVLHMILMHCRL